jgi:glycosyltransferase involved in cell wall biosynthesis
VTSSEIKVSVIVPAYRQAALVSGCLDSIAAQSYSGEIETIVVDDGCPERSGDVAARHPLHPVVVHQANGGVARARNRGVREATGTLLAFLDADDRWHPEKLLRQLEALPENGAAALAFTRIRFLDELGEALDRPPFPGTELVPSVRALFRLNFIACSSVVVHKRCVDEAGGFPDSPELRRGGQDYALWLRIAARHPLVFVPEVLTDYTVHSASRVGTDPLRNFLGAVHALSDFRQTDASALERHAGRRYPSLVAGRAGDMFRALRAERAPPGAWLSAARAVISALGRRPG